MFDVPPIPGPLAPNRSRFFLWRIAASVFFSILTMAVCVLWVRSYWQCDQLHGAYPPVVFSAASADGTCGITVFQPPASVGAKWDFQTDWSAPSGELPLLLRANNDLMPRRFGAGGVFASNGGKVVVPYWMAALLSAFASTIPMIAVSHRFCLRTQLIATTLVAVVLGVAVWAIR